MHKLIFRKEKVAVSAYMGVVTWDALPDGTVIQVAVSAYMGVVTYTRYADDILISLQSPPTWEL